ncbi:hypothetical protein [Mycobacterium ostraviense]|uniref:Uncharacterized protein n=1 Tax=Mycobacterium ostraviense TaxID=2738409 RepID=A0A162E1J7_9MYCO|nr:hypothetical protein [Mycobacterium ostraviense]KZS64287.1 hypothetical protein A4G28_07760 [Mycobacterium ostraviense]UGT92453.1 hypothetical protein LTS72_03260 [Mycobacterium ostraviense]
MNRLLLSVMADDAPRNHGPDFGKASPLGLLVIVLLVVATLFLVRSMNRQLKKVPESFDRLHPEPDQAADEGTDPVTRDEPPGIDGKGSARPPGPVDEPG